jgi:hypothetical protein
MKGRAQAIDWEIGAMVSVSLTTKPQYHLHKKEVVTIIMDKTDRITRNNVDISNRAVDGLIYGLISGVAMVLSLAAFALRSGETPGAYLEHFSAGGLTSPIQGLLSHLAVSAIYGVLFGALIWSMLIRFSPAKITSIIGGLVYAAVLLLLAQTAILPGTGSPLAQLTFWQWALAHAVYGLVLGSLFARKVD